jgi:hypothetical protein
MILFRELQDQQQQEPLVMFEKTSHSKRKLLC